MVMMTLLRPIAGSVAVPPVPARGNSLNVWVGLRLRIRRTWFGISNQELCENLGIDCDEISAYEAGIKRISANLLFRIAKRLDVGPDYFFQGYSGELD
jgi:transcriptional regulator with XRE-family HTH domain